MQAVVQLWHSLRSYELCQLPGLLRIRQRTIAQPLWLAASSRRFSIAFASHCLPQLVDEAIVSMPVHGRVLLGKAAEAAVVDVREPFVLTRPEYRLLAQLVVASL
jgi:hypothetical protein